MAEIPDQNQASPRPAGRGGAPAPVTVTLPDGSRREFPAAVTGAELAAAIGPGLAKAAVAVKIDGRPRDLATLIDHDAAVAIITREMPEGTDILRHDAAHVMAEAERPRPVPFPARGSRASRPPQARARARPVPSAGRGGRQRLLAPQGLEAVPHHRGLHAPPARRGRLPGGEGTAAARP